MKPGKLLSISKQKNSFLFKGEKANLRCTVCAGNILRITLEPGIGFHCEDSIVTARSRWQGVPCNLQEADETVTLITRDVSLRIRKQDMHLEFFDASGNVLLSDKGIEWQEISPALKISFEFPGRKHLLPAASTRTQCFQIAPDENFYGLGQYRAPKLQLRELVRYMWQAETSNIAIPFALSTRGYGLLLNTSYPSIWNIGAEPEDELSITVRGGELDYYFIFGPTFDRLVQAAVDITGRAPLPPKWALGFIQCKNRYKSRQELEWVGRTYRKKRIPCDVLVIDWKWFKRFGDLEWDERYWQKPEEMLENLRKQRFKVLIAVHPFIHRDSLNYEIMKERGFLVTDHRGRIPKETYPWAFNIPAAVYDFSNPKAMDYYWEKLKRLIEQGIAGFWTDMGEPQFHPVGSWHHLGGREKIHNIYNLLWSKGIYERHRKSFPRQRVFILSRSAYLGSQRYGSANWSGDIPSTFKELKRQVRTGLNFSLSGIPYWTTDIGGFFPPPPSPELYARWFQFGTFCPIFRTHGTRRHNEVWSFGKEIEKICTKFIRLRYKLLPYVYSYAWQASVNGTVIMRPLVMDFPHDAKAQQEGLQFMFGREIMVAPVVTKAQRLRKIYLPEGMWYDFWTGKRLQGSQTISVKTPLDVIPLYVRAGAIIPTAPVAQSVDEQPLDSPGIEVYAGRDASFKLYEDDGVSYDYEKGKYSLTTIRWIEGNEKKPHRIIIGKPAGRFVRRLTSCFLHITVVGCGRPSRVTVNGHLLEHLRVMRKSQRQEGWFFDSKNRLRILLLRLNESRCEICIHQ